VTKHNMVSTRAPQLFFQIGYSENASGRLSGAGRNAYVSECFDEVKSQLTKPITNSTPCRKIRKLSSPPFFSLISE